MNKAEIVTLVDRGLAIKKEIKVLEAEFKGIEARLEQAGYDANVAGKVEDLKDAKREGRRWLAHGSEWSVPVIFTADKLVGSFGKDSDTHKLIEPVALGKLEDFFKRATTFENRFKDGLKFRATAEELLGKEKAPAFITACLARDKNNIPKSDVKIAWDKLEVKVAA